MITETLDPENSINFDDLMNSSIHKVTNLPSNPLLHPFSYPSFFSSILSLSFFLSVYFCFVIIFPFVSSLLILFFPSFLHYIILLTFFLLFISPSSFFFLVLSLSFLFFPSFLISLSPLFPLEVPIYLSYPLLSLRLLIFTNIMQKQDKGTNVSTGGRIAVRTGAAVAGTGRAFSSGILLKLGSQLTRELINM